MSAGKTSRGGSRISQKLTRELKEKKKKETRGQRIKDVRHVIVDDFDLNMNVNGQKVDPAEGRETRLPIVIQGMRRNKSIRAIAEELKVGRETVAKDKRWILKEAWELRQDLTGLWIEEQLQMYEALLAVASEFVFDPKNAEGEPIPPDQGWFRQCITIIDKMSEVKGLKSTLNMNFGAGTNVTITESFANAVKDIKNGVDPGIRQIDEGSGSSDSSGTAG